MPRRLKIAYTERAFEIFGTVNGRDSIKAAQTDFTDQESSTSSMESMVSMNARL